LAHYAVDAQHPDVSGAEHLEMLQIRDQLAVIEGRLTPAEKAALEAAGRRPALILSNDVFGDIRNSSGARGRPVPESDIWIAAIAMPSQLTLAARDGRLSGGIRGQPQIGKNTSKTVAEEVRDSQRCTNENIYGCV
jgi:hypothetical protein